MVYGFVLEDYVAKSTDEVFFFCLFVCLFVCLHAFNLI